MATVTWYGHAALKFEIAGKILFIDPFLQNPNSSLKSSEVTRADLVYVTHDHPDHLGDAFDICKRTGAMFAAVYELGDKAEKTGVKNVARLNVGGSYRLGKVNLTVVQAIPSAAEGVATGLVIQGESLTIYDAGDTALFGDMKLLGNRYRIDLACIPVGGNFTMDAEQAVSALEMLNPDVVFPMHYGTFPVLAKDTAEFEEEVRSRTPDIGVLHLKPGESHLLNARQLHIST